jgi:LmbE family N-acetylglucosaminyl deacetylase
MWYLLFIPLGLLLITVILWVFGFFYVNDFSVPTISIQKYKRVLVVYPHPDDEALTAGGFMRSVIGNGGTVHLLILTKGEQGNVNGRVDKHLKIIRTKEAENAAKLYGVKLSLYDLGDGALDVKRLKIADIVREKVSVMKPDLVITYDRSGLYGHPDHIAVSEVVSEVLRNKFPNVQLWYSSLPKRIYAMIQLPTHMAKDKNFSEKRAYPTHRILIGLNVITKIRAVRSYTSQHQSFSGGFPIPFLPMEFYHSLGLFEYFHKV